MKWIGICILGSNALGFSCLCSIKYISVLVGVGALNIGIRIGMKFDVSC